VHDSACGRAWGDGNGKGVVHLRSLHPRRASPVHSPPRALALVQTIHLHAKKQMRCTCAPGRVPRGSDNLLATADCRAAATGEPHPSAVALPAVTGALLALRPPSAALARGVEFTTQSLAKRPS
jgi:hypothetical protein